ncbi:MAG: helix-turn-helix transcriptional regulator [Candidatus Methanomethylophilaceae archaeon]|nr:helix-turn-helix transcriptional regulator [Candidatus Methanomethylophilaceae archaeon]
MHETCTVYRTMDYISKKWAMVVLFEMRRGGGWMRFSEIQAKLGDVTPKVLSERLKELESEGLVEHRVDADSIPIRSEYNLTQAGLELTDIILEVKMWALKWKIDNKACEKLDCRKCRL